MVTGPYGWGLEGLQGRETLDSLWRETVYKKTEENTESGWDWQWHQHVKKQGCMEDAERPTLGAECLFKGIMEDQKCI